jgi:hypothetical protein
VVEEGLPHIRTVSDKDHNAVSYGLSTIEEKSCILHCKNNNHVVSCSPTNQCSTPGYESDQIYQLVYHGQLVRRGNWPLV